MNCFDSLVSCSLNLYSEGIKFALFFDLNVSYVPLPLFFASTAVSPPQLASKLLWIRHCKGKEASYLEVPVAFVVNTKHYLRAYIET